MKEERVVLNDVIGTAPPEKEGKGKKYLRIAMILVFLSFFGVLIVAAIMRRYGG